jgi:hypothetical protein
LFLFVDSAALLFLLKNFCDVFQRLRNFLQLLVSFLSTPGLPVSGPLSHIPHEINPNPDKKKHWKPVDQDRLPSVAWRRFCGGDYLTKYQEKEQGNGRDFVYTEFNHSFPFACQTGDFPLPGDPLIVCHD